MKKLPTFQENENASICSACQGKCCKSMPGSTHPSDWGTEDEMWGNVKAALKTGRWAVDYWEGDPRKGMNSLGAAYYIRPATVGREGTLMDPSWGGRCTFLTETGCSLEHKPVECLALKPVSPSGDCVSNNDYAKQANAVAWIPYTKQLMSVVHELETSV